MRHFYIVLVLLAVVLAGLTAEAKQVEVVLKTGKVILGELIRETNTTLLLQTKTNQIEISKLNVKTIDGDPPFKRKIGPGASIDRTSLPEEVLIPAGNFLMGDSRKKENFVHKIVLDAYWIDTFEVTNGQYRAFMEATGHAPPRYWDNPRYNANEQPAVGVTWHDAQAYCAWKGKQLPTEAQWERAARGPKSLLYPWGDTFNAMHANTKENKHKKPLPAGSFPSGKTQEGVYDLAGNIWEWCGDWYDKEYYYASPARNPTGPAEGKKRVIRGGGWNAGPVDMAYRRDIKPKQAYPSLGFRCARTP